MAIKIKDVFGVEIEPGDILYMAQQNVIWGPLIFKGVGCNGAAHYYDVQMQLARAQAGRKIYITFANSTYNRFIKTDLILLPSPVTAKCDVIFKQLDIPKLKKKYEKDTRQIIDTIQNTESEGALYGISSTRTANNWDLGIPASQLLSSTS